MRRRKEREEPEMLKDDLFAFMKPEFAPSAGHFETLLIENEYWKDPHALFDGLLDDGVLSDRIVKHTTDFELHGEHFAPKPSNRATQDEMHQLVSHHEELMASLGEDEAEDEDAEHVRAAPVRFVETYEEFSAVMSDHTRGWNNLPDLLDDVFIDFVHAKDERYRVVDEAVLQLTKSKEVTLWVMAASIGFPIDMTPGYDVFARGGSMAFPSDEKIVLLEQG